MNEFDRHRAFAHAGGDTFGRAMTDIAGHEDARNAGLQIKRIAVHDPAGRTLPRTALSGRYCGVQTTVRIPSLYPTPLPLPASSVTRADRAEAGGLCRGVRVRPLTSSSLENRY